MRNHGFTAIETLLTLGIVAVTAGMTVPLYRTYQMRSDLDIAVEQAKHALERAQVLARAGQNDSMWGYAAATGLLFQGESFALREPLADETYIVPAGIEVTGLTEVIFQRISGNPIVAGDILFQAANGERRTVAVTEEGSLAASDILPPQEEQSSGGSDGSEGSESSGLVSGASSSDGGGGESSAAGGGTSNGGATGGSVGGSEQSEGGTGGATSTLSSSATSSFSDASSEPTCSDTFAILPDGTVQTTGSVDAAIKVLGSQVSDGAGGNSAKVTVSMSTDDGETWVPLFNGKAVKGGEETSLPNLPSGTRLLLKVNGRHSWLFNRTYASHNAQGHMLVLRNGHALPVSAFDAFNAPGNFAPFLRAIMEGKKIKIHPHAVVFLTELDALWKGSSKFQDAAIQVTFATKPGSCAQNADPKVKIVFDRSENAGNGDLARRVYVGENAMAFAEGQWIPLASEGVTLTDPTLIEAVPGMAVERRSGIVRVLLHGSLSGASGKEIADARIIFDHAVVESVENDSGENATENPLDGIVNDGSNGDEISVASDKGSVLFQTRVTTADDAILIRWKLGQASSAASSATSPSAADSSSSQGGEETDGCAAAYTVDSQGRIILGEKADVTYSVLGSHATYGRSGPMIRVRIHTSLDGGATWRGLFNFRDILAGDTQTFSGVPAGSVLALAAEGRYSWLFKRIARSGEQAGRLKILRNGEALPSVGLLKNPAQLKSFLRDRIAEGTAKLRRRDALAIVELQDLDETADYQDAVVLISIAKPAGGSALCGGSSSSSSAITGSSSSASSGVSSSQEANNITICHFPSQDRTHPQTISVGASAWKTHEAHGDRRGACAEDDDGDTVSNAQDFCPNTYMPESVPLEYMLLDRFALAGTSGIFRKGPQKKVSNYSLADTRGCSCEQLVDVAEGIREYYFSQEPLLLRELKSLFPFYTKGARQYGCGSAILRMSRP